MYAWLHVFPRQNPMYTGLSLYVFEAVPQSYLETLSQAIALNKVPK